MGKLLGLLMCTVSVLFVSVFKEPAVNGGAVIFAWGLLMVMWAKD